MKKKILYQLKDILRLKHYSYKTEKAYAYWVRRYILFHNKRHPREMSKPEISVFLSYLAVKERVAASTQNQALNVLVFFYRHVHKKLGEFKNLQWEKNHHDCRSFSHKMR